MKEKSDIVERRERRGGVTACVCSSRTQEAEEGESLEPMSWVPPWET